MMIGSTLSHYKITAELGRGGMGIVYRARDTKLDREVAIKVLPAGALASEDDRARFYREARAAAGLNHPNIASVYGIDEAVPSGAPHGTEPSPFIAMELIDGAPLEDRIKKGPIPLREAVALATQIAAALEAAHEKNIVHRDIKSANVMLTSKGDAKVLDFGLAQTAQSTKLTKMGSTLGTIAYMSPEQAKGEEVDRRTDIWSLGVVLYEMIAGRAPYAGEYDKAVIYSILNEDPEPLTAVRTGVPMGLEWIVSKMLAKNAADRYQSAADLQVDLRTVDLAATTTRSRLSTTVESTAAAATAALVAQKSRPGAIPYIIGGVIGAALVFLAWVLNPTEPASPAMPTIRVSHSIISSVAPTSLAISPDGVDVAYVLPDGVHVLNLTSGQTRLLNGTETTTVIEFSPDGENLLLTKTVSIDRIPVAGGAPLEIIRTTEGSPRASWGPDGWIVYEDEEQIFKYSEFRGEKSQLTSRDSLEKESDYDWPSMLPGGKTMMATLEFVGRPAKVRFFDFETGKIKSTINFAGFAVRYHEPGFLTGIVDGEGLVAVPFDLESLTITGPRRSILANARVTVTSISANGTIVYSDRDPFGNVALPESRPAILTFPSFKEFLAIPEGFYSDFQLSPDEKKLLYLRRGNTGNLIQRQVVVYDFETGQNRPITRSDLVDFPVWTVDGDSVAYLISESIGGPQEIHVQAADGSGDTRRIFSGSSRYREFDFSPDGLKMVRVVNVGPGAGLLRVTDLQRDESTTIAGEDTAEDIRRPRISPDGKYVVYQNGEAAFISRIDGSGTAVNFSKGFAEFPQWSEDGRYYFHVTFQGAVQRFRVATSGTSISFPDGFDEVAILGANPPYFDVFSDGQRAIIGELVTRNSLSGTDSTVASSFPLHFVFNWFEELK